MGGSREGEDRLVSTLRACLLPVVAGPELEQCAWIAPQTGSSSVRWGGEKLQEASRPGAKEDCKAYTVDGNTDCKPVTGGW